MNNMILENYLDDIRQRIVAHIDENNLGYAKASRDIGVSTQTLEKFLDEKESNINLVTLGKFESYIKSWENK